jgi:hypothetical protein
MIITVLFPKILEKTFLFYFCFFLDHSKTSGASQVETISLFGKVLFTFIVWGEWGLIQVLNFYVYRKLVCFTLRTVCTSSIYCILCTSSSATKQCCTPRCHPLFSLSKKEWVF